MALGGGCGMILGYLGGALDRHGCSAGRALKSFAVQNLHQLNKLCKTFVISL